MKHVIRCRTAAVCLQLAILLIGGCAGEQRAIDGQDAGGATTQLDDQALLGLLKQSIADAENIRRRHAATNHGTPPGSIGQRFLRTLYPVKYAEGKLLAQGRGSIDGLLRIACDEHVFLALRARAWEVIVDLNGLDERPSFDRLLGEYRLGHLDQSRFYWIVQRGLPIDNWLDKAPLGSERLPGWLTAQAEGKDFPAIALGVLDECMKPERFDMPPRYIYFRTFLNKENDRDLDEWLSAFHPRAGEFRNRIIQTRGFDPAGRLAFCLVGFLGWDDMPAALAAMFPAREDQEACLELVQGLYGDGPKHADEWRDGWQKKLREWYKLNRERLVYDHKLHRFVVTERLLQGAESR